MCECGCKNKFNIHNNPKSFFYVKKEDKKKKTTLSEKQLYKSANKKINNKKKNNVKKKKDLKIKSNILYTNGQNNSRVGGKNKAVKRKSNRVNVKSVSNKIEKTINGQQKKRPPFLKNY